MTPRLVAPCAAESRGCATAVHLRKHHQPRLWRIPVAAVVADEPAKTAGWPLNADYWRTGPHGVVTAKPLALRQVRETAGDHPHLRDGAAAAGPYPASEPARVEVSRVRAEARPAAHVPAQVRLQAAAAEGRDCRAAAQTAGSAGGRQGASARPAQSHQGTAGGETEAGRGRPAGPRQGTQAGRENTPCTAVTEARRQSRTGVVRGPRLPQVRVPGVLRGDGELPAATRNCMRRSSWCCI